MLTVVFFSNTIGFIPTLQNVVSFGQRPHLYITHVIKNYNIQLAHIKVCGPLPKKKKIFGHPLVLTDEAVLAGDSRVVDEHVYTTQVRFDPMEHLQNIILVTQVTELWIQSSAAFVFC